MDDLARKSIFGLAQFIFVLGMLLFVPAWTFDFWQAWFYLFVFAVSVALITLYLWKKDPELLERRVNVGPAAEKEKSQKRIQTLAAAAFIGIYILPVARSSLFMVEGAVIGCAARRLFRSLGFFIVFLVFKENTYSAGTIEVAPDQKVISTGAYALVRHPMYSGALVMLFATPLALGSWWGLIMFIPMTLVIVWRLLDEERFLPRKLQGYVEYREKVRSRLLPLLW